jgi:Sec-independent protein translocase protein TatA
VLDLSPAKLLVIALAGLVVLGPEKLPQLARDAGSWWAELRRWRTKLESEVRSSFPELPPTHRITAAVRSPLSFLDQLADEHEGREGGGGPGLALSAAPEASPETPTASRPSPGGVRSVGGPGSGAPPADPSMN